MKKDKIILGSLAIAGFLVTSYFIISACHIYTFRYSIYGAVSSPLIFLNLVILVAWLAFGQVGLWIFVCLSAILVCFISIAASASSLFYQVPIFFAVGFLTVTFKNSVTSRALTIERQIENLEEERNALEAEYSYTQNTNEALKQKVIRYAALKDLTGKLSTTLSLEAVTNIVIDSVFEFVEKTDTCLLFFVEEYTHELALKVVRSKSGQASIKSKKGDIFDLWVLKQRQPLLVSASDKDFRFNLDMIPPEFRRGFKSLISAPLVSNKKVVGIIRVESREEETYASDDLRLLTILSDLAAIALENAKLYRKSEELALKDGLTGLYRSRYYKERLDEDILKARRLRQPLSLLMMDIDHFKGYNDEYGHIAGDIVLRDVGEILSSSVELGDLAARYGGEEFVLILFGKEKPAAQKIAESIRNKINDRKFFLRKTETHVTFSVGCATLTPDMSARDELVRAADAALYEAKKLGGNRVCCA